MLGLEPDGREKAVIWLPNCLNLTIKREIFRLERDHKPRQVSRKEKVVKEQLSFFVYKIKSSD